MAKRKSPFTSLQYLSGANPGSSNGLFDHPQNAHVREHMCMYLALCIIRALPLNVRAFTEQLQTDFGVNRGEGAVGNYLRDGNADNRQLWAHLKYDGPDTQLVKEWKAKAREEAAGWPDA